jgi:transcriptional regulator with XRE-family HTH domain
MSGVSARTVEAIELGKANPAVGTLERVCNTIGLVVTLSERVKFE